MKIQYYDGWAFFFDGQSICAWRVMPMYYFPATTAYCHYTTRSESPHTEDR